MLDYKRIIYFKRMHAQLHAGCLTQIEALFQGIDLFLFYIRVIFIITEILELIHLFYEVASFTVYPSGRTFWARCYLV